MGVDFISTCAKSYRRSWDRGLSDLATPGLFAQIPPGETRRTYIAYPRVGQTLKQGQYRVQLLKVGAVLYAGSEPVDDFQDLPAFVTKEIETAGCGVAVAHIHHVSDLSGTGEATIR